MEHRCAARILFLDHIYSEHCDMSHLPYSEQFQIADILPGDPCCKALCVDHAIVCGATRYDAVIFSSVLARCHGVQWPIGNGDFDEYVSAGSTDYWYLQARAFAC